MFILGLRIYRNVPYFWAACTCLVLTSSRFVLLSQCAQCQFLSRIIFVIKSDIIFINGNWILDVCDMAETKTKCYPQENLIYLICKNKGIVYIWLYQEGERDSVKLRFTLYFWSKSILFLNFLYCFRLTLDVNDP